MEHEEILFAGVARQATMIRSGDIRSEQLVSASLERIGSFDGILNAFREVLTEEALAAARAIDASGPDPSKPLNGVPIAIKNDAAVAGHATRHGSNATSDAPAPADSEVTRRLRDAGAVIVGITNVPELTQWPFTESDAFGVTRNPWDPSRTPGGSSGGSAAAVAAGMVGGALGSDGGGSIRIPASCCGLYGIKPQRGRVPLAPKLDAWHGLSVYGPLARTVGDAALMLDVLSGEQGRFAAAAQAGPGSLRIGYSAKSPIVGAPIGAEQRLAMEQTVGLLERLGHTVVEVDPSYGLAIPVFVARYLRGISDDAKAVARPELLESRTRGMARAGGLIGDRLLAKAMAAEPKVLAALGRIFDQCDVLVTPGLAASPLPVGRYRGRGALWTFNGVARFTPFCAPWNVTGQPAVSIPAGFDSGGLPLAVQVVGRPEAEELLVSLSAQLEDARPWAQERPALSQ